MSETIHGSAVLVGADALLIRGPSGSGKSTLAARLVSAGARLVADDRVTLSACHGRVIACGPAVLEGKLELRGRGIGTAAHEPQAVIRLVVDLLQPEKVARLPEEDALTATVLGIRLPRQPAPARSAVAELLVDAALRALAPQARGLRMDRLWG